MRKSLMRSLLASALYVPAAYAQDCTMPPAAVAAGYIVPTFRGSSLSQWTGPNGTDVSSCGASQNKDGTIHLAGGQCNGYNDQIDSVPAFGGGGYFEATLSWTGKYNGWGMSGSTGWPSWWANDIETMRLKNSQWPGQAPDYIDGIEPDFMEFWSDNTYGTTMHNWYGGGKVSAGLPVFTLPAESKPSQPHRYGFLWEPATASKKGHAAFYFDGAKLPGSDVYWNKYDPNLPPAPVDGSSAYSVMDVRHLGLILGTGADNPMTVYSVDVWQRDTSKNIGSTNLPVNALTSCRPTTFRATADVMAAAVRAPGGSPAPQQTTTATTQAADPAAVQAPRRRTVGQIQQTGPTLVAADPFATVVTTPVSTHTETTAQPTGNGSFLSLSGASDLPTLLSIMKQNADIARSESGGTMPITLAPGDITPGSGGTATDAHGNVFTLPYKGGDWGSSMGQPVQNGNPITDGTGWVNAIRIVHGVACFQNAKGLGWGCQGSGAWVSDPGPSDAKSSTGGLAAVTQAPVQAPQRTTTQMSLQQQIDQTLAEIEVLQQKVQALNLRSMRE